MTEEQQKTAALVSMAMEFWTNGESPSEDDIESVFWALATRDTRKLRTILINWNISKVAVRNKQTGESIEVTAKEANVLLGLPTDEVILRLAESGRCETDRFLIELPTLK